MFCVLCVLFLFSFETFPLRDFICQVILELKGSLQSRPLLSHPPQTLSWAKQKLNEMMMTTTTTLIVIVENYRIVYWLKTYLSFRISNRGSITPSITHKS